MSREQTGGVELPGRPHADPGGPPARKSENLAGWLGVDAASLDAVPPPLRGRIQARFDDSVQLARRVKRQAAALAAARRALLGLRAEARLDPLTGALNRRGIDEALRVETSRAERTGSPLAILVIDVNGLKQANDDHGHAAGDALLRAAASATRAQLRATDHFGRIGGDEFLAVLPGGGSEQAEQVAERIIEAVGRVRIAEAPSEAFGISVGVASTSEPGVRPRALVRTADRRMYERRATDRPPVPAADLAGRPAPPAGTGATRVGVTRPPAGATTKQTPPSTTPDEGSRRGAA